MDKHHLAILSNGVASWNDWRKDNPDIRPDLNGVDLRNTPLRHINLRGAKMIKADLRRTDLRDSDLRGANLRYAELSQSKLNRANLSRAFLSGANLSSANLTEAIMFRTRLSTAQLIGVNLSGADLTLASLRYARLVDANLSQACLKGCAIYGISAWNVNLTEARQADLVITRKDEPTITVDNLEVAQFVYLLLNNTKIRDVIDTITTKAVLILGRFTPTRKAALDLIRDALRSRNYVPILFDFDKPESRNFTETISTLAHLVRFIIADITTPRVVLQELQAIVPSLEIVVQPLLDSSADVETVVFSDFQKYPWVMKTITYSHPDELIKSFDTKILNPIEKKIASLNRRKSIRDRKKAPK
jgi:uncharacterized protein YjbI with pentapeptide repeats